MRPIVGGSRTVWRVLRMDTVWWCGPPVAELIWRDAQTMLWTILIILAIVALVLFILGRVRGGRGI